jgi:hypothetical protein
MLQGVWVNPVWQKCGNLSVDLVRAMEMLSAHSQRDYAKMEALGIDWINNRPLNPNSRVDFDGVAWSGIVLSRIHSQRWSDLPNAIDLLDRDISVVNDYAYLAKLAVAMAEKGSLSQR